MAYALPEQVLIDLYQLERKVPVEDGGRRIVTLKPAEWGRGEQGRYSSFQLDLGFASATQIRTVGG